jgi:hypothetical protein
MKLLLYVEFHEIPGFVLSGFYINNNQNHNREIYSKSFLITSPLVPCILKS